MTSASLLLRGSGLGLAPGRPVYAVAGVVGAMRSQIIGTGAEGVFSIVSVLLFGAATRAGGGATGELHHSPGHDRPGQDAGGKRHALT